MQEVNPFQTWTFSREAISDIAKEFRNYYDRKKRGNISISEARMLIDHASGPAPGMTGSAAIDYTRVKVTGGGLMTRPSDQDVQAIYDKRDTDKATPHEWDIVFDEIIEAHKEHPITEKLIFLCFRDRHSSYIICDELYIGATTFYNYRRVILEQAALIAIKKAVLVQ